MTAVGFVAFDDVVRCKCRGTVEEFPEFDATEDVEALRKAMKGLGTDEDTIIRILGNRSSKQRQEIKNLYKGSYGRDLIDDLHSELSGHFRKAVEKLMLTRNELLASIIRDAVEGFGTKECEIICVLCMLTNAEIEALKETYAELYNCSMEEDLKDDLSGHFKHLIVAILTGSREEPTDEQMREAACCGDTERLVDMDQVRQDVEELFKAGEDRWGTDEDTFVKIFSLRSLWHLEWVDKVYAELYGHGLAKALKNEMSGHLKKALETILASASDRCGYFAEVLKKAMQGLGTNDRKLTNIVVWRCEIDMLQICGAFEEMNGKSLQEWIKDDTSGDYRKMLLELVTRM